MTKKVSCDTTIGRQTKKIQKLAASISAKEDVYVISTTIRIMAPYRYTKKNVYRKSKSAQKKTIQVPAKMLIKILKFRALASKIRRTAF